MPLCRETTVETRIGKHHVLIKPNFVVAHRALAATHVDTERTVLGLSQVLVETTDGEIIVYLYGHDLLDEEDTTDSNRSKNGVDRDWQRVRKQSVNSDCGGILVQRKDIPWISIALARLDD